MTSTDSAAITPGRERDRDRAPDGASCRIRRSYGPSHALAPTQEGGGGPAGSRARAHGNQPDSRHQGAPVDGGQAEHPELSPPSTPRAAAFPERKPRRRTRNSTERTQKLTTRLSEAEKTEIITAANNQAVTAARFLAAAGLAAARGSITVNSNEQLDAAIDELAALRAQVSRVGNNVNQIAYIYNSGGQVRPGELAHALTTLTRTLARVDDAADALVKRRTR